MAGCRQVTFDMDWGKIPVYLIHRDMTPMTETLTGNFGKYAKRYAEYERNDRLGQQAKLFDNWYVLKGSHLWDPGYLGKYDPTGYLKNTAKILAKPLNPLIRFYLLKAGQELKPHVDFKTKCCINFVYQRQFSGITVEGVTYPYGRFLLDNTKMHGVPPCTIDRFIVSFSFGERYEIVEEILRKNGILKRSSTTV